MSQKYSHTHCQESNLCFSYCLWSIGLLILSRVWVKLGVEFVDSRLQLKCDGPRRRTGGEVKGKLVNGVGSQYPSHYLGTCCIQHYHHRCRFKWTRTFRRKTKSGFCMCAITFQLASTFVDKLLRLINFVWMTYVSCCLSWLDRYYRLPVHDMCSTYTLCSTDIFVCSFVSLSYSDSQWRNWWSEHSFSLGIVDKDAHMQHWYYLFNSMALRWQPSGFETPRFTRTKA